MAYGSDSSDLCLRAEEISSLTAIYDDHVSAASDASLVTVRIPEAMATLSFHLPDNYPSSEKPTLEVSALNIRDEER